MDQQIKYVRTIDGVNLAYTCVGEGPAIVKLQAWPFSHLEAEWWVPTARLLDQRLAERMRVVRFDPRGSGLSQRNVADLSLEARLLDLETVVDHLHIDRLTINGYGSGGPVGIAYAARHPDRVSHLFLIDSFARGGDFAQSARAASLIALASSDWDLFTETVASVFLGWSAGEPARRFAAFLRECVTPDQGRAAFRAAIAVDVTEMLQQVTAPTFVFRGGESVFSSPETAGSLASAIPNATFFTRHEVGWITSEEIVEWVAAETFRILGLSDDDRANPLSADHSLVPSGTAVILFADIVDSTALTERMGDAAFRAKARELDGALRAIITEAGGTTIDAKTLGDGVLATFPSASQAIDAALRCGASGDAQGLLLHLGLHAGDVIREANNVFGGAVNIASRISGLSAPGEVLVSDVVRALARTSAGVAFEDRGEHALKGVAEPQRVFAVRASEAA